MKPLFPVFFIDSSFEHWEYEDPAALEFDSFTAWSMSLPFFPTKNVKDADPKYFLRKNIWEQWTDTREELIFEKGKEVEMEWIEVDEEQEVVRSTEEHIIEKDTGSSGSFWGGSFCIAGACAAIIALPAEASILAVAGAAAAGIGAGYFFAPWY